MLNVLANATPSHAPEPAGIAPPDAQQKRSVRFFMTSTLLGLRSPVRNQLRCRSACEIEQSGPVTYDPGDLIEYTAAAAFDLVICPGDVGTVTRAEEGWVWAVWPRSGEHSVPLEHVRDAPVLIPEPWWRPEDTNLSAVKSELESELSPGHALYRVPLDIRARCGGCDEVLVSVADGTFALVHLTWSRRREEPPYPLVNAAGPWTEVVAALEGHADSH